jgi:Actinobacteria/chloroflexi VLRF1 release factor
VPAARVVRWFENFEERHGATAYDVLDGRLHAAAADGSTADAALPFDRGYDGPSDPAELASATAPPNRWGVLLVRKGGFAVARLTRDRTEESKVGQRHVQGRTKAGGQSQQRFARRRDNQATAAYAAAADHAARILTGPLDALVTGGDVSAVDAVLGDARLSRAAEVRTTLFLPVPDPRRSVLDGAVADACSVRIDVQNA